MNVAVSTDDTKKDFVETGHSSPRRETFLARYQRKFKVGILVVSLAVIGGLFSLANLLTQGGEGGPKETFQGEVYKSKIVNASQAENLSAALNDTPASAPVVDPQSATFKLDPAPFPALVQDTPEGGLPKIAEDGTQPWQAYAHPFNTTDSRPRIAIVVAHMGMGHIDSDAAINRLPSSVTLLFSIESPGLAAWCAQAREKGHETMLDLPMEPFDYPRSDPGAHALLTNLSNSENLVRLLWGLRQGVGFIGVTSLSGSRFTTDPEKLKPIMLELKKRGLLVMDTHVVPHSSVSSLAHEEHVPLVTVTAGLDQTPTPEAIDAALSQLEQAARVNGMAVGMVSPLPITLDRLDAWLKTLPQRGIALAPLSAMVQ